VAPDRAPVVATALVHPLVLGEPADQPEDHRYVASRPAATRGLHARTVTAVVAGSRAITRTTVVVALHRAKSVAWRAPAAAGNNFELFDRLPVERCGSTVGLSASAMARSRAPVNSSLALRRPRFETSRVAHPWVLRVKMRESRRLLESPR